MPPRIATIVYLGFVVWLFRRDFRERANVTGAIWIPFLWLVIIGSRFVSEWLDLFGVHLGGFSVEDGSPVDALFFAILIGSGVYVLNQRRVRLSEVVRNNRWLTVFLAYCLLSILWSDYPLVSLKRWLKVLGHPIMVLVLLTEPDPEEAVSRLIKRCAYVWVPISILFIKYYPEWGRGFSNWTGEACNFGITLGKNMLGLDCFILGAFFVWYFLKVWRTEKSKQRRNELIFVMALLAMIGWLLDLSQSSTSLVSFLIAVAMLLFLGFRWVKPQYMAFYLLTVVVVGAAVESTFGVYTYVLHLLGKDPTLTDRTLIWKELLKIDINPIVGTGFESFWLGDRLKPLWAKWLWHPNEAHNGYLETYLNLGLVGLFLLLVWFVVIFQKACRDLRDQRDWGRFRLAFLVAVLFYNWTEAALRAQDAVYFVFYIIAMDYPKLEYATVEQTADQEGPEETGSDACPLAENESAVP